MYLVLTQLCTCSYMHAAMYMQLCTCLVIMQLCTLAARRLPNPNPYSNPNPLVADILLGISLVMTQLGTLVARGFGMFGMSRVRDVGFIWDCYGIALGCSG